LLQHYCRVENCFFFVLFCWAYNIGCAHIDCKYTVAWTSIALLVRSATFDFESHIARAHLHRAAHHRVATDIELTHVHDWRCVESIGHLILELRRVGKVRSHKISRYYITW